MAESGTAVHGLKMRTRLRARQRLPFAILLQRLGYSLKTSFYRSPLYRVGRLRSEPGAIRLSPPDPWPGNATRGSAIVHGEFTFAGQSITHPEPIWAPPGANLKWLEELHGFEWLRDLRAAGGDIARRRARELAADWVDQHQRWSALAWRPDLIGSRLSAWFGQHDFFWASGDAEFQNRLAASASAQARHLLRALPGGASGSGAIRAIKGLIFAGLALPRGEAWAGRGIDLLKKELRRQIQPDGGHVERSPASHLQVLRDLIDIRAALIAAERDVPSDLQIAIDGMAPVLRLYQHGDGGLALFNDTPQEEGWLVDLALTRAGARIKPLMQAPQTGFQRLLAGRTLVLVDSGRPPRPGSDAHAHAGTLSFEMSLGRERLIVNCGAHPGDPEWRAAQRLTAAHSTLVVEDTNSSEILPDGRFGHGPSVVLCRRQEDDGNLWLELSHDGYQQRFGLVHHRRLYLAATGEELRGEDKLVGAGRGQAFTIRFHLHPQVQASLLQNAASVLLKLPSGAGWRLRSSGGSIVLEQSVYLGRAGEIRRSQQVVIAGKMEGEEASIKWVLRREAKPKAE
jgi:uncharacterized heparinase superfamily protein